MAGIERVAAPGPVGARIQVSRQVMPDILQERRAAAGRSAL